MSALLWSTLYAAGVSLVTSLRSRPAPPSLPRLCLVYAPDAFWLIPLLLIVPTALREASVPAIAVACAGAAMTMRDLRPARAPRAALSPRPEAGSPSFRIATFNVFGGAIDIDSCLALLERQRPDVVFLQEAWWASRRHAPDTLPRIAARFEGWHSFRSSDAHEMMIISRHPFIETREERIDSRPCLVAVIALPGARLRLVNVHLDPPATRRTLKRSGKPVATFLIDTENARRRQTEALFALIASEAVPTVACGDFNSPPHAYPPTRLGELLTDAFSAAGQGPGYTYPQALPLWRIDYVMTSSHLEVVHCGVPRATGSDHLPVVADLRLRPDAQTDAGNG